MNSPQLNYVIGYTDDSEGNIGQIRTYSIMDREVFCGTIEQAQQALLFVTERIAKDSLFFGKKMGIYTLTKV